MSGFPCARPEYAGFAPCKMRSAHSCANSRRRSMCSARLWALSTLSFSLCTDDRAAASDVQGDQRGGADDASVFELQ